MRLIMPSYSLFTNAFFCWNFPLLYLKALADKIIHVAWRKYAMELLINLSLSWEWPWKRTRWNELSQRFA